MITGQSIVFLGASGAVGGVALNHLGNSPQVIKLTLLARRNIEVQNNITSICHVVDTVNPESYARFLGGHNVAVCTMGVGEPSTVSREEFKRIDHDAVLAFAKACRGAGVKHFILLGSVGASSNSRSFYLKSKGALRDAIETLGFESVTTFQPSMIVTPQNRYGLSQGILLAVWPIVSKVMIGSLSRFRGIPIELLGKAIALTAVQTGRGDRHLHWAEIQTLAGPVQNL